MRAAILDKIKTLRWLQIKTHVKRIMRTNDLRAMRSRLRRLFAHRKSILDFAGFTTHVLNFSKTLN